MDYLIMEAVAFKIAQEDREEQKKLEVKRWQETRGKEIGREVD